LPSIGSSPGWCSLANWVPRHKLEGRGAETLAEIRKITGGGTDFALETSAVPAVFRLAIDGLRGLGTCILVGSARAGTEVSSRCHGCRAARQFAV
jgi:Zn-dependent alcohol dehydrogenase